MPDTGDYERSLKELARHLAALRLRADISGETLADRLGITQASISRIERGRQRPRSETVIRWAEITEASNDELDAIASLYEALNDDYISFRQEHRRGASESQRKTLAEESAYDQIRVAQTALVPGLLQTPGYAKSIFKLGPRKHSAEEIERSVKLRAERHQQLYDESRQFDFLVFEQALWATYAPPRVMTTQFHHIAEMSTLANVWIGIVPLGTRLHSIPIVAFETYGNDAVIIETNTGFLTVDDPQEVKTYIALFDEWARLAVDGSDLVPWLEDFESRYTS